MLIRNSLCHLVSARLGDEKFTRRHTVPFLIGSSRCDRQCPLASVHLHPEVTVEPPAGIWHKKKKKKKTYNYDSLLTVWLKRLVCWSVHHFVPDWNPWVMSWRLCPCFIHSSSAMMDPHFVFVVCFRQNVSLFESHGSSETKIRSFSWMLQRSCRNYINR